MTIFNSSVGFEFVANAGNCSTCKWRRFKLSMSLPLCFHPSSTTSAKPCVQQTINEPQPLSLLDCLIHWFTPTPAHVRHKLPLLSTTTNWIPYTTPWVRKSHCWGEMLLSPIHCCDVTNPPYLLSGELCTSPLHSNRLFVHTVCCRRCGQCFSVLRTRHTDVVGDSSGRSYVTEQWHNVPLLRTRELHYALD